MRADRISLLRIDQRIEAAVHRFALRHDWVVDGARVTTHLGDPLVVTGLAVVLAVGLAATGRWRAAAYVSAVRVAALGASWGLKALVDRARPELGHPLAHASGSSFPSGHALGAAAVWGALAVLLAHGKRARRWWLFGTLAVVVPMAVAATRVILGVHYISDVVAGLAVGWALALGLGRLLRVEAAIPAPGP